MIRCALLGMRRGPAPWGFGVASKEGGHDFMLLVWVKSQKSEKHKTCKLLRRGYPTTSRPARCENQCSQCALCASAPRSTSPISVQPATDSLVLLGAQIRSGDYVLLFHLFCVCAIGNAPLLRGLQAAAFHPSWLACCRLRAARPALLAGFGIRGTG